MPLRPNDWQRLLLYIVTGKNHPVLSARIVTQKKLMYDLMMY
ncbi:MAG: hypothetical protein OXC40_01305 [Proteobacteria bacterium]|nr:hypothetical protein [Pseudomonadota bacterium]